HGGTAGLLSELLWFGSAVFAWIAYSRIRGRGFLRMPVFGAWAVAGLAVVTLGASFVVPSKIFPKAQPAAIRPASTAKLSFVKPTPDEKVRGGNLEVVLRLTGGTIVPATTTTLTPDKGHIHLSVDGSLVSMTYGTLQSVDLSKLSPGTHELEAEFVAADHGPFN